MQNGTVVVVLNVDDESFDSVVVDDFHASLPQLDKAIEALTDARDALRRRLMADAC